MIIGHGMVAGAFKELTGWDNDILYAAGVSNSASQDDDSFSREIEMVKLHLDKISDAGTFVYFSTTSIFDPEKASNPYIKHKLLIEEMLRNSNINTLIIRLPNLVGISRNPHTLTNFFADCIRNNRKIKLSSNAVRHLIDVDDLSFILNDINAKFGKKNLTVNVQTDHPLIAGQILSLIEKAMQKKADVEEVTDNSDKMIIEDITFVNSSDYLWVTGEGYHEKLINKYYSA